MPPGSTAASEIDGETLLRLAMSRPPDAAAAADAILRKRPDPLARSYAQQARGIVFRETGNLVAARRSLAAAVANARRTGDPARTADTLATAGTIYARAGRLAQAVAAFDEALSSAPDSMRGPVLLRRGTALHTFDRYAEAEHDYREAAEILRSNGEPLWLARALSNLGFLLSNLGRAEEAEAVLAQAEPLHVKVGQHYEAAFVRQNLAWCAYRRGDLPAALHHFAVAQERFALAGTETSLVLADRCEVMLAAGLAKDALACAREAHEVMLRSRDSSPVSQATTLLSVANAALAAGDRPGAESAARRARQLFSRGRSEVGAALAGLALIQSRATATTADARRCREIAETLESRGRNESLAAHLLGGIAGSRVRSRPSREQARAELTKAARGRSSGNALDRAMGWQAVAVRADMDGDAAGVLEACEQGLNVLDEHRLGLGATEMRAAATAHGAELAELALRYARQAGDPLLMLTWSERWRATALSVAPVRPPGDKELAEDLAGLRELTRRITEARQAGLPADDLTRQRTRLEETTRDRTLRTRGNGSTTPARFEPSDLQRALGRSRLVELLAIDGQLHVVVLDHRGAIHIPGGPLRDAAREVDLIRFALHRLSRPGSRGARPPGRSGAATLSAAAEQLQQVLLGDAVAALGAASVPLVVIPPGRLHAVPWGLLPAMRGRAVTVAPSAAVWLRGHRARGPRAHKVVLVRGPDLSTGGAEVPALMAEYPGATALGGGDARTSEVLRAMDGAWLVHIAAHASFRSDNPMFSALHVDDGPLTVHDLGRLRRAPYRVVLSACESGLGAAAGSDELLGLASALVPLGTASLLASVVPVNDEATVPLMLTVHEQLRAGRTLAEALRVARLRAGDQPIARATAAAFVALGAG
jgi:tetratricopeptide (TPR) repeat protein